MADNKSYFIREECDRCGAPLSRAKQKGKYICQYCGAVYYGPNYSGNNWEDKEDFELPEPTEIVHPEPVAALASLTQRNHKNIFIFLAIGVLAIICLIIYIVTSVGGNLTPIQDTSEQRVDKPEMLAQLPKAAFAGQSIAYGNWEITIQPEIAVGHDQIAIALILQNWNDSQQTFRYTPNAIIVYDDLANSYPLYLGNCDPDVPYMDRQITFKPYEALKFESTSSWCSGAYHLPLYSGVIPQGADHIYIYFDTFGVFQNITFVIDL